MIPLTHPDATTRPRTVWSVRVLRGRLGAVLLLVAGVAAAAVTLAGLAATARHVRWDALVGSPWLVLIVAATVGGYACQSLSFASLLPNHLTWRERMLLPWGNASVNRVTPAATGSLWLSTRVMRRSGVSVGGSALTLAALSLMHTLGGLAIAGIAVACGAQIPGGTAVPYLPTWVLPVLSVVVLFGLLGGRRIRRKVKVLFAEGRQDVSFGRLPLVLVSQAGARFAPVLILAATLHALGHPLPLASVVVLEMVAATGSIIPLPGGGGGVEIATTALLTAAGVPFGLASGAVLASRVLGYWLPALAGVFAVLALRGRPAGAAPAAPEPVVVPVPVLVGA